MHLHDNLAHWARHRGDRPALTDPSRCLTFRQLTAEIEATAAGLRQCGFSAGDRIGVALRDSADLLVAVLAIMRAGLVAAPLDWRAQHAERALLAAGFGLRAILVAGQPRGVGELAWPLPALPEPVPPGLPVPLAQDPVVLLLSSGTTGSPSGALISGLALDTRLQEGAAVLGDLSTHLYLSCIPLCFSLGLTTALRMLAHGSGVYVHAPLYTPAELLASATRYGVTALCLVPAILRSLLRATIHTRPLPDLRLLIVGGATLPPDLRQETLERFGPDCFETYGAAAAGPVCYTSFQDLAAHPGTVGRPHDWLESHILDDGGKPVAAGQAGHLAVRGATVASALLDLDGGCQLLDNGWYQPGDLASLDTEGYLRIHGRSTDVINRGGVNVYPELVEHAVQEHPAVVDVAVVGCPRDDGDEEVIALVVSTHPGALAGIEALCRARLSPKYLPDRFVHVDGVPKTASGKVRRAAARDLWLPKL